MNYPFICYATIYFTWCAQFENPHLPLSKILGGPSNTPGTQIPLLTGYQGPKGPCLLPLKW